MAKSKKAFKAGDRVAWDSSQGVVNGTVERVVTKKTTLKGHVAEATPDHPEVLVKSAKTGAEAVHLPSALRRVRKPA
jgi:hypothetical protein